MGLIDTDEAVGHFRRVIEATTNNNDAYNEGFIDALEFCIATLSTMPSSQPEQQWIPRSERMPEENGQYLITVKYKHVNDSYEDVYAEHGEWTDGGWDMFCFGHCGEVEDIIAWMPLPEPYKGDKHE